MILPRVNKGHYYLLFTERRGLQENPQMGKFKKKPIVLREGRSETHVWPCLAISDEIQVAKFASDETTIFEINAMIVLLFLSWLSKLAVRCQQRNLRKSFLVIKPWAFFTFSFRLSPSLSSWLLKFAGGATTQNNSWNTKRRFGYPTKRNP